MLIPKLQKTQNLPSVCSWSHFQLFMTVMGSFGEYHTWREPSFHGKFWQFVDTRKRVKPEACDTSSEAPFRWGFLSGRGPAALCLDVTICSFIQLIFGLIHLLLWVFTSVFPPLYLVFSPKHTPHTLWVSSSPAVGHRTNFQQSFLPITSCGCGELCGPADCSGLP